MIGHVWGGIQLVLIVALAGDEIASVVWKHPTITQTVVRVFPWWIMLPFLAWVFGHFFASYVGSGV